MAHILSKKEWNVYNADNREKVRHLNEKVQIKEEKASASSLRAQHEATIASLRAQQGLLKNYSNVDNEDDLRVHWQPEPKETDTERLVRERNEEMSEYKEKMQKQPEPWYSGQNVNFLAAKRSEKRLQDQWIKEDPLTIINPSASRDKQDRSSGTTVRTNITSSASKSTEQLRDERLEREAKERAKALKLLRQ